MIVNFDDYIIDIVEQENQKFRNKYNTSSLAPLHKPTFKDSVKDSPSIFRIDGNNPEDDSIITISNRQFPNFVNEAVEKANSVAAKLTPQLSKHILRPASTGEYGAQSYAFWPRHVAISNKKHLRYVQIRTVNSRVLQWLCDVTATTQLPVELGEKLTNQYINPLTFLISENYVSSAIKRVASDTLKSIEATQFRPVSVLQHGDLWYGNILLERSWPVSLKSPISFFIIDWGGANIYGYPYVDQLRYSMSLETRDGVISRYLNRYSSECNLSIRDMVSYICAYAGHLGMNRNEFPLDRYLKLIDTLILKASYISSSVSPQRV